MESDTRQLLSELREDHRNMALVLNVLESTVETATNGEDPDFELIGEVMRYMTVYPDAVHHPKEDLVYAELKKQRPDLAEGLDDVPEDHKQIAALGSKLREDVEAIVAGAAVRREQFIVDALKYVGRLRSHMTWEEEDLFNRIDTMIGENSHAVDVGDFTHIKDPVFELEVEAAFRRLVSSLRND
jgi:hemerythrin-like domain-containing protein